MAEQIVLSQLGMERRRKDPLEKAIPAVGALFTLGIFFIPGIGQLVPWAIGLLALGAIAFVAVKLARNHTSRISNDVPSDRATNDTPIPGALPPEADQCGGPEPTLSKRLRTIDWFQFEKLVAAVYEAKNYTVTRLGGANPDGGVDLMVENPATKFVVQCKQWKSWKVGVLHIREFLGTMTDSGVRKGVFITLQGFSEEARELAAKHGIDLLDEREIIGLLEKMNWRYNPVILAALEPSAKRCPKCENKMVLRTAKRGIKSGGKFWGCLSYPRCRYILTE